MLTIGIDPGNNGGATILDSEGRGVAWAAWRPRKGGYVFTAPEYIEKANDLAGVGVCLGRLAHDLGASAAVSIEGLVIRKTGRVAPSAILTLAFGAGALFGGLASVITVGSLHRPTPEKWARLCGGTGPKQSEAAFRRAKTIITWTCYPPDRDSVGSFECMGAIGEAAMMALWARQQAGGTGLVRP